MHYLDTSYLAKLYVREVGSDEIVSWMTGKSGFVCCMHGRVELIAALKRHLREQRITPAGLATALHRFEAEEKTGLVRWLPLSPEVLATAFETIRRLDPATPIRAADALHLASAADAGLKEIYSHDRHMLGAASAFGLRGIDVIKTR